MSPRPSSSPPALPPTAIASRAADEGWSEHDPRRLPMLITAVLSQTAISLVQFGLPALSFALHDELDIGPARFGLLYGTIAIGSAVSLFGAGRACDLFGARPVLLSGTGVAAGGLALAALAPGFGWLVAALFVAGLGGAAAPVAGMSAIIRTFPPERRGVVLGLRQMAVPAGGALAALLLPPLARLGGLRLAFAVPAAVVLVSGIAFAAAVGGREEVERPRSGGRRLPAGLTRVMVVGGLYVTALAGVMAYTAGAARDAGLSERQAETVLAAVGVSAAAARVVCGRVADGSFGTRRVATLVQLGLLGTVAALAFPLALRAGFAVALLAAVPLAFGTLGFNGIVYLLAGEIAGPADAGAAVGAASTVVLLVGAVSGPVLGLVVEHVGYEAVFVVAALVVLAGAAVARGISLPPERSPATATGPRAPVHSGRALKTE